MACRVVATDRRSGDRVEEAALLQHHVERDAKAALVEIHLHFRVELCGEHPVQQSRPEALPRRRRDRRAVAFGPGELEPNARRLRAQRSSARRPVRYRPTARRIWPRWWSVRGSAMPIGTAASDGNSTVGPSMVMRSPRIVVIGRQFLFEDFPKRRGLPHRFGEKRMGVGERNDPRHESLVEIIDIGGRARGGADDRLNRRQRVLDPVMQVLE